MSEDLSMEEQPVEPWLAEGADVAAWLETDPSRGLSNDAAAVRLERCGPNRIEPEPSDPAWRKLLAQFADPLVYLLLGAVAIALVTWGIEGAHGVPFEALVI